jgi:hypothetical protein
MANGVHDRIPIRRHRIAALDVYEISGEELEQLNALAYAEPRPMAFSYSAYRSASV